MPDEKVSLFGTGHYTGTMAILSVPAGVVQKLLDPRLEPAPQQHTPAGQHLLYFLLGQHSDVRGTWPILKDMPIVYNEAYVAIPYVRFRGHQRDFFHMPRLYLDQRWPTWMGAYVFGFHKIRQDVTYDPGHYAVTELDGARRKLWSASTTPIELAPELDPDAVMVGFDQPLLGIRNVFGFESELACWMTFDKRKLRPARVKLDFTDKFLLDAGLDASYDFLADMPFGGAVHIEYDWTLTFPTEKFDR